MPDEEKRYITASTIMPEHNGKRMYELCTRCDLGQHMCRACGEPLTHSGHDIGGKVHNRKHPYCYE